MCAGTLKPAHRGHTEGADDRLEQAGDGGPSSAAQTGRYQVSGSARRQDRLHMAAKAAVQHEEWRYPAAVSFCVIIDFEVF